MGLTSTIICIVLAAYVAFQLKSNRVIIFAILNLLLIVPIHYTVYGTYTYVSSLAMSQMIADFKFMTIDGVGNTVYSLRGDAEPNYKQILFAVITIASLIIGVGSTMKGNNK